MGTRQNFNINTQAKLLDIHKQFQGGLKTVDTDDALQDFYLRQADNVSISEFGFLEKRYGLGKKETMVTTNDTVQGHYYFKKGNLTDELLIAGGKIYLKADGQTQFTAVTSFAKPVEFAYPTDVAIGSPFNSTTGTFQATREVGAARIKDNLYIFTGSYPLIYTRNSIVDASDISPTVYVMPFYVPNWDEIVALNTGINLLIDDYGTYYGGTLLRDSTYKTTTFDLVRVFTRNIESTHNPLIPTTSFDGTKQLSLEARIDLEGPSTFYAPFTSFQSSDLEYQTVSFDPKVYYLAVDDDLETGQACAANGLNVVDNNGDYFQCVALSLDGTFYNQVIPVEVKYRVSGSAAWLDVPEDNIVNYFIYSNGTENSNFNSNAHLLAGHLDITSPKVTYASLPNATTTAQNIPPLSVDITGFSVGTFDFQVTWAAETHYIDGNQNEQTSTFKTFTADYPNVKIASEAVNAASLGYKEKALWTCNKVIEHYSKLMVWGSTAEPEYIFISHPQEHNWFPANATVKFDTDEDEPVSSVVPFMNVLIVQSETKTWGLKGQYIIPEYDAATGTLDTTDLYAPFNISPIYGTIAPKSVRPVRNRLYFLSKEGIVELTNLAFAFDEKYNINELDRNIKNIVPRDPNAVAIQHDYQYWINFPATGETLRYYVDKKSWVRDTYGIDDNDDYEDNRYDFDGVFKYYSKDGELSFISNATQLNTDSNPAVYKIVVDKSLPSDFGLPFKSIVETANLNQGYPFHPKKYLENRMDFTLQNEYNTSKETIPITNVAEDPTYAQFRAVMLPGHQYQLGLAQDETITDVEYILDSGSPVSTSFSYDATNFRLLFDIPYEEFTTIDIKLTGSNISLTSAVLKDNTYDHTLRFNTWSISEQGTLNLPNVNYDVAESEIEINLGTVFGPNETWIFDESDFGNRITAVKTVKLSGRGYNYKLFFTDRSRAKWTLESLGITFKFKRARGER